MIPSSSNGWKKALLVTVLTAGTLLGSKVSAGVIVTDFNDETLLPTSATPLFFWVGDGAGGLGNATFTYAENTHQFRITYSSATANQPTFTSLASGLAGGVNGGFTEVALFAAGDEISATSTTFAVGSYLAPSATGLQYFGLRLSFDEGATFHYGWAEVLTTVDADPITGGNSSSVVLSRVAYNLIANQGLLAGTTTAIPEPATYAAMAGLLAGTAALLRRRQQRKAAAV